MHKKHIMSLIGKEVILQDDKGDGAHYIEGVVMDKIRTDDYCYDDEENKIVDCYVVDGWCYSANKPNARFCQMKHDSMIYIVKSDRLIKIKK